MSLVLLNNLKIMSGFDDIEFIMKKACREAIDRHPEFEHILKNFKFSGRKNDPYHSLYEGGNVVRIFFLKGKICGNIELAGRWEKNYDPLIYLNTFQINDENDVIELIPDKRWEVRVDKKNDDKIAEKIYVFEGEAPRKEATSMIKYFIPVVVLSIGGIYMCKKRIVNVGLSNYLPKFIGNTFDQTSKALDVS